MTAAALSLMTLLGSLFGCRRDQAPGSLEGGITTVKPGSAIRARAPVSFEFDYQVSHEYDEGSERAGTCHYGRYKITMTKDEDGRAVCDLRYTPNDSDGEERSLTFTTGPEAFDALGDTLAECGATELNGYSASNSALGHHIDLTAEYKSGQVLRIYANGGASVEPDADLDAILVLFNRLADEEGLRFTRLLDRDEMAERLLEWARAEGKIGEGGTRRTFASAWGFAVDVTICPTDEGAAWNDLSATLDLMSGRATRVALWINGDDGGRMDETEEIDLED